MSEEAGGVQVRRTREPSQSPGEEKSTSSVFSSSTGTMKGEGVRSVGQWLEDFIDLTRVEGGKKDGGGMRGYRYSPVVGG